MIDRSQTLDDYSDSTLLTVPETAEVLRISRDLVYELINRGELPAIRLGRKIRVPAFGLKQWIAHRAGIEPTPPPSSLRAVQQH